MYFRESIQIVNLDIDNTIENPRSNTRGKTKTIKKGGCFVQNKMRTRNQPEM